MRRALQLWGIGTVFFVSSPVFVHDIAAAKVLVTVGAFWAIIGFVLAFHTTLENHRKTIAGEREI